MNRAPLYCILHACSDNEDTTKLFLSFNLLPFINNAIAHQLGVKRVQCDYVWEQYLTLAKQFQLVARDAERQLSKTVESESGATKLLMGPSTCLTQHLWIRETSLIEQSVGSRL